MLKKAMKFRQNRRGAIKAASKSLKDKTSPMKKERLLSGVKARLKKRRKG